METGLTVQAHGKVNLTLDILGKLPDGYHAIRSLVCPISLADIVELEFSAAHQAVVTIDVTYSDQLQRHLDAVQTLYPESALICASLATDSNLAVRAAKLMLKKYSPGAQLAIRLHKCIPFGAGLGGGSSDAAAVLLGLWKLIETPISCADLVTLAGEVGSDVAATLIGQLTLMHGRGELIEQVRSLTAGEVETTLESLFLVVVKPLASISTAHAYSSLGPRFKEPYDLDTCSPEYLAAMVAALSSFGLQFRAAPSSGNLLTFSERDGICEEPEADKMDRRRLILHRLSNDFEQAAIFRPDDAAMLEADRYAVNPASGTPALFGNLDLREVWDSLTGARADRILLAGSGSSIVGFFLNAEIARAAASGIAAMHPEWFIAECSCRPRLSLTDRLTPNFATLIA